MSGCMGSLWQVRSVGRMSGLVMAPPVVLLRHVLILAVALLPQAVAVAPTVTPANLSGQVLDMIWRGPQSPQDIVLATTSTALLYRSTDGGKHWVDISPKVPGVLWLMKSECDANVVLATAKQGHHESRYVSTDAGATWRPFLPKQGLIVTSVWLHSTSQGRALVMAQSEECMSAFHHNQVCSSELWVTQDLGDTDFQLVQTHVVQFSWGPPQKPERIYYTEFIDKEVSQPEIRRWMPGLRLSYTDDWGRTPRVALDGANKFAMSDAIIFAVVYVAPEATEQPEQSSGHDVKLMVSKNSASTTPTFNPAILSGHLAERSYMVLDVTEGRIVLHVGNGKLGDIYVSDTEGSKYTLSLRNNVRQNGGCAFQKMVNIDGVFVANVKVGVSSGEDEDKDEDVWEHFGGLETQPQTDRVTQRRLQSASERDRPEADSSDAERLDLTDISAPGRLKGAVNRSRRLKDEEKVVSLISFNNGGTWQPLQAPAVDSSGKKIDCGVGCGLHLHDITEYWRYVPIYSYRNAVGIIMGTGNVGDQLDYALEKTNTYLSRDGGVTWMQVHEGSYIYEYGNHGALLVMVNWLLPTNELLYTWDQGATWETLIFSTEKVRVKNVIIEPHALSLQFVILAATSSQSKDAGVELTGRVFHVDFRNVLTKACQGRDKPGDASSDYELWTPHMISESGSEQQRCLLGQSVQYTRRKPSSQCYNDKKLEVYKKFSTVCECSRQDFECEALFAPFQKTALVDVHTMSTHTAECSLEDAEHKADTMTQCDRDGKMRIQAYRRIPGDKCIGGWEPEPLVIECSHSPKDYGSFGHKRSSASAFVTFLKYLVIFACCCGVPVACCPQLREKLWDIVASLGLGSGHGFQNLGDESGGIGRPRY